MNTIHDLFRRRAAEHPDSVAVSSGDELLSYRELDEWSDQIARTLVRAGACRGDTVAVAIKRSAAYPAAVLGVLKAGCAYVPLDESYPAERRDLILTDSGAVAVLVDGATDLPGATAIPAPRTAALPACELPEVSGGELAYVIFTSGSTGTPKSVLVEHQQVLSLVLRDERLHVRPGEKVAMFAPVAFDASTFELWNTLCRGGELVVIGQDVTSVAEIGQQLRRTSPQWIFLTTGLFHLLAEYDPGVFDSVGTLITGGDVLSPRHVHAVAARRTARVFAAYGPTETTTFASLHEVVPPQGRDEQSSVPIGRPLSGVTMKVLDERGVPVLPGTTGELYIGGTGVARGYHNAPDLTSERFAADPVGPPGQRHYRTGDLALELPDGEFEFHGRVDRQVKVRGHRVEPGEIEVQLTGHRGVRTAVVAAVEDSAGIKRLVAYYVPASDIRAVELRGWLGERLPSYMEPSTFVAVDEIPLDANGKPDRRALPYPWSHRDDIEALPPYRKPATPLELAIAATWADSLGLDKVGLDDDFYELGGDSLHSVDVLARMRREGIEVSALRFFRNPTVGQLAAVLEKTDG